MDDLENLRSAFPEQPAPSPAVVSDARRQLQALAQPGRPGRRWTPAASALRPARLGTALTAVAASVAVVALGLPLLTNGGGQGPVPNDSAGPAIASPSAKPLTARQVLLVAAESEERAEPTSGRYFRVRTLTISQLRVGRGNAAYMLDRPAITETWTGAKGGTSWTGVRDLGAKPATAADLAKWRKAGSPATWNLGPSDTADQHDLIISSKPEQGRLDRLLRPGDLYPALGSGQGVTSAEIRALPTDPAGLRQSLLAVKTDRAPDADDTSYLTMMTAGLLMDTPAPPKVRGAALRLLAGLPGATVQPGVEDLRGRTGTAVTFSFPQSWLSVRLIIEPSTGKLLSSAHWGGKTGSQTVLTAGWTNDEPRIPAAAIR